MDFQAESKAGRGETIASGWFDAGVGMAGVRPQFPGIALRCGLLTHECAEKYPFPTEARSASSRGNSFSAVCVGGLDKGNLVLDLGLSG